MTYKAKQHECKGSYGEHWNSVVNSLRGKVFMVLKFLSIHKGWVQPGSAINVPTFKGVASQHASLKRGNSGGVNVESAQSCSQAMFCCRIIKALCAEN